MVEGLVDGLVAQVPLGPVGIGLAQVGGDLRRAPLLLELVLHDAAQLGLTGQQRSPRSASLLAGPGVSQVAVVDALVVRPQATQLPADRRRGAPQSAGNLADTESAAAQGGDPLALQ